MSAWLALLLEVMNDRGKFHSHRAMRSDVKQVLFKICPKYLNISKRYFCATYSTCDLNCCYISVAASLRHGRGRVRRFLVDDRVADREAEACGRKAEQSRAAG